MALPGGSSTISLTCGKVLGEKVGRVDLAARLPAPASVAAAEPPGASAPSVPKTTPPGTVAAVGTKAGPPSPLPCAPTGTSPTCAPCKVNGPSPAAAAAASDAGYGLIAAPATAPPAPPLPAKGHAF
eukprot:1159695-Pelagomonas_calceolata.AAC.3